MAIAFGRDPDSLAPVRARLQAHREASVLRDIPGLVRQLERLYWRMQADGERGQLPVPDLSNLDVYYEIGMELDLEGMETLDDAQYRAVWREKLARWNDFWPLKPDARLWSGDAPAAVLPFTPRTERKRA
jgi:hypothetical protein